MLFNEFFENQQLLSEIQSHPFYNHLQYSSCAFSFTAEWCDNLDFPVYNDFVIAIEICGDLILLFVLTTIIRSKCQKKTFHLEMVGAEAGLGGIFLSYSVQTLNA